MGRSRSADEGVAAFNDDVTACGGYLYTTNDRWSSHYAVGRQTAEMVAMLRRNFPLAAKIADIGCGDGTYTFKIANELGTSAIRGVDPAQKAIDLARRRIHSLPSGSISFEVGSVYDVENKGEDLAIVRGVLHHLARPSAAIARLASQFTAVLALEPNGYNPVLKIIERASNYHRRHGEQSYWPPSLNRWFREEGFSVVEQRFFCAVPYFFPTPMAKALSVAEPALESVPILKHLACGTNLVLYRRLG
jgi:SAM-dependent methyltransferase